MFNVRPLLLLLSLLIAGCATKVEGLRADPSFTPTVVGEATFVMALVGGMPPLPLETSLAFAQEMRIGFLDQRPNLRTVGADALRSAMGGEGYDAMRDAYGAGAPLGTAEIAAIKEALPTADFAIVARVDENRTQQWREQGDLTEERISDKGSTYTVRVGERITSKVRRTMTLSLSIIDLNGGGEVWGGRVTKSQNDERVYDRRFDNAVGVLFELFNAMSRQNQNRFPYPLLPEERPLLRRIFAGFAENLPKAK